MKKCFLVLLTITIIFTSAATPALAYSPSTFEVTAKNALMVSLDTGETIYSKNPEERCYPASLTKIMTALLLIEKTKDFQKETITVSKNAINAMMGTGSSVAGLVEGEVLTVEQILYYLLLTSAGDSTIAIAEHCSGSESAFVDEMNSKAAELGMNGTHYVNPHGLHDPNHYTTAYDLSILTKEALKYDIFKKICSESRYKMPATNKSRAKILVTTNMLQDISTAYYYKYAAGVKTGFTDEAGRCLISTAKNESGYSYLLILLGCKNNGSWGSRVEFNESKKLYEWAFSQFEYKNIFDTSSVLGEAKVKLSLESDHVSLLPKTGLSAILPKKADLSTIKVDIKLKDETVNAPVKKGDNLGTAEVSYAGQTLGTLQLVAGDNVKESFILKAWDVLVKIFTSTAFKIILALIVLGIVIFISYVIIINKKRKRRRRRYR